MATVKLNLSMETDVVATLRERSAALGKTMSGFLADLVRAEAQRSQDELAAEGYRLLSNDFESFAAAALPLAEETWPAWTAERTPVTQRARPKGAARRGREAKAR